MDRTIRKYLAEIGRKGGKKSRRLLRPETAKQMVRVREARRAFKKFYAECFWSYNPKLRIGLGDVSWVAEQLMKSGGRMAWISGAKFCH